MNMPICDETTKQEVIEYLWLIYFNDSLYARGIISKNDRDKMKRAIQERRKAAVAYIDRLQTACMVSRCREKRALSDFDSFI